LVSEARVVLGLGSSLGHRESNLKRAINRLTRGARPVLRDPKLSKVYESSALTPDGAPDDWDLPYLNCALSGEPLVEPEALLARVREVEQALGRSPSERWAPRCIDIDILWWPGRGMETEELRIPHTGVLDRAFVLEPLRDLVPEATLEGHSFREHAERLSGDGVSDTVYVAESHYRVRYPELMGILNVTPDSFSDGGKHARPEAALAHAWALVEAGAAVIDLGAESTRPAGEKVEHEKEWARIEPVLQGLMELKRSRPFRVSLDSRNPKTVMRALDIGIDIINDVTGFSDPAMMEIAQGTDLTLVFMHSLSIPVAKGEFIPTDSDPVHFLQDWGRARLEAFDKKGVCHRRLVFDPGIGFGKTSQQNWQILGRAEEFHQLETPLLIGHSRKSLFELVTDKPSEERDSETLEVSDQLAEKGVDMIRIHDVGMHDVHFRRRLVLT
jgi:2-amino-4-hydroxy-6-hydroxymethyldihydropteridine diphosphokinase/dihydropteroate synthase